VNEITGGKGARLIFDRLEDGRFKPVIAKVFPLQETVQAYQYLESNVQIGKVVIKVG
jgi:NADPH:quinone reductase-like Zn-dependent oxidoreductase